MIKLLIAAGVNVNQADSEKFTPLHYAAYHNNVEATQHLLDAGAQVSSKDACGSPLHWALEQGAREVAALLNSHAIMLKNGNSRTSRTLLPFPNQPSNSHPQPSPQATNSIQEPPSIASRSDNSSLNMNKIIMAFVIMYTSYHSMQYLMINNILTDEEQETISTR